MRRLVVIILGLLLTACGTVDSGSGGTTGAGAADGGGHGAHSLEISRADLGGAWPLTVRSGPLACEAGGEVTFTANGKTYAVNGMAMGTHQWHDIRPIWADSHGMGGPKKNIGPLIARGLKLCGNL